MNLLIITAHYPAYDVANRKGRITPFLQHYAKEWVEMNNDVKIIHLMRKYPDFFYVISELLSKVGYHSLEKYTVSADELKANKYCFEGVKVERVPYQKYIPHTVTSKGQIRKLVLYIRNVIDNYQPDIIIGDCFDPVLQIIKKLKNQFKIPYVQIVHNSDFLLLNDNGICDALRSVDSWMFRSNMQKTHLTKYLRMNFQYGYMYSGIEEYRFGKVLKPRTNIKKLLYVGALLKSKGLNTILEALSITNNKKLTLKVVGSGVDDTFFHNRVRELGISRIVSFEGGKPHDDVFDYMYDADALVLISQETFGMVYVEAMSQGCVPIGTVNEGIDGVVINGQNGFLSHLNNPLELAALFDSFLTVEPATICRLSNNAYETAKKMTNKHLAANAIESFRELLEM